MVSLGFASGDVFEDAWPIRLFASRGFEMCIAQSFAKNFGLYGERVGALHVVVSSKSVQAQVFSQMAYLQRAEVSTPPAFGARIVERVLQSRELRGEWAQELEVMAGRVKVMRRRLYGELCKLETPGEWVHIVNQVSSLI